MTKHGTLAVQPTGPVMFRLLTLGTDGRAMVEMGFDYSKAEVPDRAYYADYCDVVKDRFGYTLIFGKLVPGGSKLRTKIEISFPEDMFVRQLWMGSREFHTVVAKVAAELELPPLGRVEDTDKVQSFRANNVFMGAWGEEAVMDFYYLSPRDLHLAAAKSKQGNVANEPVVRVAMGTVLTYEFLEKCRPLVPENLPESPKVEVRV